MRQQEIEFFWPLTEQMPLDLDYSDCNKAQLYGLSTNIIGDGKLYRIGATGIPTWSNSIVASNMTIDVGTTVFKLDDKPPLYRRVLYKLMNIRWEKK
jgi:hypothetical protein